MPLNFEITEHLIFSVQATVIILKITLGTKPGYSASCPVFIVEPSILIFVLFFSTFFDVNVYDHRNVD